MKKIFLLFSSVFSLFLFSCSQLEFPESLSVNPNLKLTVPAGRKVKSLFEYIDIKKTIDDAFPDKTSCTLFDYQPLQTPYQEYAICFKILDFPLSAPDSAGKIPINLPDLKLQANASNVIDLSNFSLDEMLKNMPSGISGTENISFQDIQVYLYAVAPPELGKIKSISAKATYTGQASPEDLIDRQPSYTYVRSGPSFCNPSQVYTENLAAVERTAALTQGLTNLLNARVKNLKLKFEFDIETNVTEISKTLFSQNTIQIFAVIVLPLRFDFTGDVVYKAYSADSDMMGRSGDGFDGKTAEMMDNVKKIGLGLDIINGTGLSARVDFTDSDRVIAGNPYKGTGVSESITFDSGKSTFDFTGTETRKILESKSFCPEISVVIPPSKQYLKRNAYCDIKFNILAEYDGYMKFF